MKKIMAKLVGWLRASNRWKHLLGIFAVSLVGTVAMGVGCIMGMEFKDVHHSYGNAAKPLREWRWDAWDWQDCLAGAAGCALAAAVHAALYVVMK